MRSCTLLAVCGSLLFLAAPASAQDVSLEPMFGDVRLKEAFMPDPHSVSVTSGGSVEVAIGECDYGYVASAPDVDLYYTTSGGSPLYVYAEGDGDTMLLINAPNGDWYCDDDTHGNLDPIVAFENAEDGLYNIWVGSYSEEYLDATLYLSELDPLPSGSGDGTPDISLEPTYGDVELEEGFLPDPHEVALTAGGGIEVSVGSCTYGYVADAPDVDFYYETSGGASLYIYVQSDEDTTLLVNRPDGTWVCDDDGYQGTDPVVEVPAAARGLYNIWVGTYGDDGAAATLFISELDPR